MSSVKDTVLSMLEQNKGINISGSHIADEIGVSRNAVWKAIKSLQTEGYVITASTNKGYCFCNENDMISEQSIKLHLKTTEIGTKIDVFKSIDSTNTFAKKLAQLNCPSGSVIIAEEQTAGKGRMGRDFYSPNRSGIYFSVILRPQLSFESATLITTCASVAIAKAIENLTNLTVKIKWVNDIYINGKKACGILTEAGVNVEGRTLDYVIIGIGINVSTASFPEILKDKATSLELESKKPLSRNVLIAEILNNLEEELKGIEKRSFLPDYIKRSNILGREISVISPQNTFSATAIDIDENANLIIRTKNGQIKTLNSGEISIRTKDID